MNQNTKVIIVQNQTKELEDLIAQGYRPTNVFPHAKGAMVFLVK